MCSSEHVHIGIERLTKDNETEEQGKQKIVKMGRSTAGTKKLSLDGLTVARAYHPPGSLLPKAVNELHNKPNKRQ